MPRRNKRTPYAESRRATWFDMPETLVAVPDGPKRNRDRPVLLPMVATAGRCPTRKMRYGTPEDAAEALRRALINREILQSPVVEDRWYPQPGDAPCICHGYHLTHSPRKAR